VRGGRMSEKKKKMALIVHSGTMDKLYAVFMLANSAAAMDMEVHLFFTFWGLNALKKGGIENAKLPGFMRIGTGILKKRIKEVGVPTLLELLKICKKSYNVKVYACSTTMELMKVKKEDLIPEVDDIVGATAFIGTAMDADISMFI
jgi:peroxiredoxin family protein